RVAPGNGAQPAWARRLPHRVGGARPAGTPRTREHPMTAWQVYKFGGSSLGAERRLPVVLPRGAAAPRSLARVVGALGDTTGWRRDAGRAAAAGDETRAAAPVARAIALARTRAAEVLGPGALTELEGSWGPIVEDAARALSALSTAHTLL